MTGVCVSPVADMQCRINTVNQPLGASQRQSSCVFTPAAQTLKGSVLFFSHGDLNLQVTADTAAVLPLCPPSRETHRLTWKNKPLPVPLCCGLGTLWEAQYSCSHSTPCRPNNEVHPHFFFSSFHRSRPCVAFIAASSIISFAQLKGKCCASSCWSLSSPTVWHSWMVLRLAIVELRSSLCVFLKFPGRCRDDFT